MSYKTVVTKANLQYYHGKLKRLIDNIGDVKGFKRADTTSVTRTDPLGEVYEDILPDAVSDMKDTWYASSSIRTIQIQNYDQARGIDIADYQNPNNNVMRFDFYLGSGGAGHPANTIYKKAAVDAKFDAINGMSFRLIDPTINLDEYNFIPDTLEKFLNKANYNYYDSEKPSPSAFANQICLYPVGDEYYEYVFIEGPNGFSNDDFQIEFVGSTKQDLTGYLQDGQIEAVDNDYIDYLVDYKYMPEGLYDALGNELTYGSTIIDSSLSSEPIFVTNSMMTQVITGVNEAFEPGSNVKTLIVDRNESYAVDGDNFEGMRNLPRIETLVLKCGVTFAGDCFSGCTSLRRIYVYSDMNLTEDNLGNCTAKIIKVEP